ncbi:hypothetical protein J4N45_10725 [Vibrio sp. SCSIO 43140]|uniref:P-II family nitrogen regulator n=1 Tax=Vibrio sp. SCSIO 43140 TaxID=2819100 RepID=UPI002075CBA4|nr:P-II family nitrogen regulator [Vibrio sp. SCSIO 43140]USD59004.1 hypothetical protein J4N45_10725 [Vibrio sp. SCSIO 43140]
MIDKISVILQEQKLEDIERILSEEGVRDFTIYQVQGRGSHANLIDTHALNTHYQLDIFIGHNHTQTLVGALLDTLCVSKEGNGVTSVIRNVLLFDNNRKNQISSPSYNHKLDV